MTRGRFPDVTVLSVGHDVADGRLHRVSSALMRAGLTVEVVALGDAVDAPPGAGFRGLTHAGMGVRALRAAVEPWRARGRVLVTVDPDLTTAAAVRRMLGKASVVDVHEDYLALLADRPWAQGWRAPVAKLVAGWGRYMSSQADLTVVADDHLPPRQARERFVVRNVPTAGYLPPPSPMDAAPRAIYVGDVRGSRGLFSMLGAIERAPGWSLDIVGPVAADDADRLRDWQSGSVDCERVRLHGRLAPADAWSVARGAWVGMALLDDTPAFAAAIPSKLFEYLGCGLAVLASPLPRMVDLLSQSHSGVSVDPANADEVLRRWSAHPGEVVGFRDAAAAWAAEHLTEPTPYDELALKVAALVRRSGKSQPDG